LNGCDEISVVKMKLQRMFFVCKNELANPEENQNAVG